MHVTYPDVEVKLSVHGDFDVLADEVSHALEAAGHDDAVLPYRESVARCAEYGSYDDAFAVAMRTVVVS